MWLLGGRGGEEKDVLMARTATAAKPLLPQLRQLEKDFRSHREAKSFESQIESLNQLIKNIESATATVELRSISSENSKKSQ